MGVNLVEELKVYFRRLTGVAVAHFFIMSSFDKPQALFLYQVGVSDVLREFFFTGKQSKNRLDDRCRVCPDYVVSVFQVIV